MTRFGGFIADKTVGTRKDGTRKAIIGALVVASTGIALLIAEVGVRVYQRVALGTPLIGDVATHVYLDGQAPVHFSSLRDGHLGWRPTPELRFDGSGKRADGSEYPLHVSQNANGFRSFGALNAAPRILFIGDSFTQAVEVSDDQTFHALLSRQLAIEPFAYASRGYATLQESLAIDAVFDQVAPDVIVWQFCMNDWMANDFELERSWTASPMGMKRPFWKDGTIVRRIPESFAWLLELAGDRSRLLYLLSVRYERVLFVLQGRKDILVDDIHDQGMEHPGFRQAVENTREILANTSRRVSATPIVIFEACTTDAPFHPATATLAGDAGMTFVADLPAAVERAASNGKPVYALDGIHWSPEGHEVVAEVLRRTLQERGLAEER